MSCHICMLEVFNFGFGFTGNYNKEIVLSIRRDFGLLKCVEIEILWGLRKLEYITLHYDTATSMWVPGTGMWWFCENVPHRLLRFSTLSPVSGTPWGGFGSVALL